MKDNTGISDRAGVTITDKDGNVVKSISTDVKKKDIVVPQAPSPFCVSKGFVADGFDSSVLPPKDVVKK